MAQQNQAQQPAAIQERDKGLAISQWLRESKVQAAISRVLPQHLKPETMIQIAITTIQRNPYLAECTPLSIIGCVIEASQLGLSIEPSLGQAYLVPFRNLKTGKRDAILIPGYRGLVYLARNTGHVSHVSAEVPRACDLFSVELGSDRRIVHKPNYSGADRQNESTWIGAYAVAEFKDGTKEFTFLERERVLAARARSKSYSGDGDSPWRSDAEAMWRKTAIRRLAKLLPQSPDNLNFHRAVDLEERRDMGLDTESLVDLSEISAAPPALPAQEPRRKSAPAEEPANKTVGSKENGSAHQSEAPQQSEPVTVDTPSGTSALPLPEKLSKSMIDTATKIAYENGWGQVDIKTHLKKNYGIASGSLAEFPTAKLDQLIHEFNAGT